VAECPSHWEAGQYHQNEVDFACFQLRNASAQEIIRAAGDASILMLGLPGCKLIIRHGDGYDNLDLEAATLSGIVCANKPGFSILEYLRPRH
jgi:lactate dehydrogenase-like 2-hydroxyacid dehydrogenase